MMMHKALHLEDDIDRRIVSRKERRKGFVSIKDCVDATIQQLEEYIKKEQQQYQQK